MDRMQAANDLELGQVVIETVMGLADQHDSLFRERRDQGLQVRMWC